jgi:hypothetical protein
LALKTSHVSLRTLSSETIRTKQHPAEILLRARTDILSDVVVAVDNNSARAKVMCVICGKEATGYASAHSDKVYVNCEHCKFFKHL